MAGKRTNLYERYELGEVLGKGGMGVVYRARDTLMDREVALKTLLDIDNPLTLELFYKECGVLAGMVHPNIINVYDVGEFEDNGVKKPFFVMPLLPGATLDKLIKDPRPQFTVETLIEIISQACRGLQAAHELGLVHRDIKPSNIFVMDDHSVKIIDFGIARSASMNSMTSLKGTLAYMAPEQLELKAPTPLSDQYAMAVVCYEALTRRRPFQGNSETQVADAILRQTAPPVSDVNPNVRYAVSQVIHKGMARQPFHRFPSVREFSDALTRAMRSETLEYFDTAKIKPRLERANAAFEHGDFEFANEVLTELEGEGYLEQDITLLRRRLDQSMRQLRVRQLLESANRYSEAQEFPLALRKIQEALEIDPEHGDALAMRNRVEKGRREKKVDEWLQLARQHIDNQSFGQAREALENALKVKPNDTDALRMQAEIARREDEIRQAREKKAAIYESAVKAWERGDVTNALTRLDQLLAVERESPDTDSGRSSTYQSFYNQVRSEHDGLKNSYEEARRQLGADNFAEALAICRQYLQRYPNHALFQSLQFDVEERQRQKLSALIAETDRRVDQEQDLDVRVAILEEAARQYPQEKHFQSALKLVRDKRDLVQSIVTKAQLFEDREQFNDALDQWQILRSIHAGYPGLEFEIERVKKNRDAQARLGLKALAIEKIDRHIETGEYHRAEQTLAEAMREFPNDPEFAEMEKLIRKSQDRTSAAMELFQRAREAGEAGRPDDCLDLLRQAQQADSRNPVIRTVLINTLLDRAGALVGQDYASAEPMVREVLDLEPNHAGAQSLLNQAADRRREEFVTKCATQARKLQVEGNLEGALAEARTGLDAYPRERTLQQLESTLQRALGLPEAKEAEATQTAMPSASFGTTRRGAESTQTAAFSEDVTAPLYVQRPQPAPEGSNDPTNPLYDSTKTTIARPVTKGPAPPSAPPAPPAEPPAFVAAPEPAEPPIEPVATMEALAPAIEPPPAPPPAVPAAQSKSGFPLKLVAIAAGVLLLLGIGAMVFLRGKHGTAVPAGANAVTVQASQPQASILIDDHACGAGTCQLNLAAGQHRAEARMDGYAPAFATFEVQAGTKNAMAPVVLTLTPRLPAAVISTNLTTATVTLDQGKDQPVQNGEIQLPELAAGPRVIKFKGEGTQAVIALNATPATAPQVVLPIQQQNLGATLVTGLGGSATVYTTLQNAEATLDGKPAGKVEASGLALTNLAPGAHELVVTAAQASPHRVVFDSGAVPSLSVFLGAERNIGMLRITTGEDDVTVYVNGEKQKRTTQKGRLVLNLEPKVYKIRVEKPGFTTAAEQTIEIKKGEEGRVDFQMARMPTAGSVMVQKAPAGAEVLIDGAPAGTVHDDGTLSLAALKPGSHSLTVHKDMYKPLTKEINVVPGQQTDVEATLQLAAGTVKITIAPGDVHAALSWKRDSDGQTQNFTENPLTLAEGSYTIAGHAADYEEARTAVKVTAGQQAVAVLVFKKIATAKQAAKAEGFGLAEIEKLEGWSKDNGSLVRTGGNVAVIPVGRAAGTYTFTAMMLKGKRLEWLMNYVDAKNNVSYELSADTLTRTEYADGKKLNAVKNKVKVNLNQWVKVQVDVTGNSMVTTIQSEAADKFTREGPSLAPGLSFTRGQFAFRVPGKDRMALAAFSFTAK